MRRVSRRCAARRWSSACLLVGLSAAAPVFGAERTWISSTSRFFHDTGAWSGGVVPGSGDSARFNLDATYSALFVTSPINQFATFSNGTVSFDLGNQTYTLSSTSSPLVVGTLNLFTTFDANLSITSEGGTLQTQSTSIGNLRGPGTVSVGSAAWNSAGTLTVGNGGAGSLNINGGGFVFTPNVVLGSASAGNGFITIGSGGTFTAMGGSFSGGGVTFDIGGSGNGTIKVNSGGFLNCGSFNADIVIGRNAGSDGTINLSGGSWTTVLSTAGGIVNVGLSGSGTINASSGTISCRVIQLGVNAGAAGSLNVSGTASVTTTGIGVGGTLSQAGGSGQVTVSGGTLNGGQIFLLSGGTVNLNGGHLNVSGFENPHGVFNWTAGALSISDNLTVSPGGLLSTLTLDANKSLQATALIVGDASGAGTVNIIAGSHPTPMVVDKGSTVTVNQALGTLGAIYSGTVSVANAGTLSVSGDVEAGGSDIDGGTVTVSGSHLSNQFPGLFIIEDTGVLKMAAGSTASLTEMTVKIANYASLDASNWTMGGPLYVAQFGHASLDLQNGSVFQASNGRIGDAPASVGTVNVSGAGSAFMLGDASVGSGTLVVGGSGTALLNVSANAMVSATAAYIGQSGGAHGSVLVDASRFSAQQDLYVGQAGTGTLVISGGGSLQCAHGYVGTTGNAVGTVILSGAGSSWTGSAGLDIGGGQSGWFTLGPGTMLTPGGSINVAANGVLDCAAGSLGTTSLALHSGRLRDSGTFAYPVLNSNGTIEVDSGALTFTSPLTNSAGSTLTKMGAGEADIGSFIVAGAGTVVVNGGTIRIGSDIGPSGFAATAIVNQTQGIFNFAASQHLSSLNINTGRVNLLANGSRFLATGSLTIGNGATLDLNDNDLEYNYTGASPYSTIAGWILSGRNGGMWDGPGITASTAAGQIVHPTTIGILEGFQYHSLYGPSATFDGQDVFNSTLLLKYTLAGDANFDDVVNSLDFTMLASNFNSSGRGWVAGDFNYDGIVNTLDFNALATNFGQTLSSPALGSLVPEPAILATMCLACGAFAVRRRPRRIVGSAFVEWLDADTKLKG